MTEKKDTQENGAENSSKNIVPRSITSEMKESYLDYAMSVITSRALPDVRDGLKPVQRRILYSMHRMGLVSTSKFRKSAVVVGDVLGNYHPHGDASVYDAMVKMAQGFLMRYQLIAGQGNFGNIDGDSAAAMRYTEAKMSKLSGELLKDIEKETVKFRPNYDGTKKEPTVLPSAAPNLLLNGTLGIAVGMATNIPPHNLGEVIDATVYLIDNKNATTEDLLQFIKGPDFPTGGLIFNEKDIHHAYATGRGGVVTRGVAEIVEPKAGSFQIVVTSLPYRVNKADLIVKIAELVRDKKIEGIKALRDESTRDIRIVIELKTGSYPQKVLNYLYKHTALEDTFHFNVVALVNGIPHTLALKGILQEFIKHRIIIIRRRTEFDLRKAEEKEHILLGLKKALDHIDKIIKLIKAARDVENAHSELMKTFKFSDRQATAILEMKLQKLAGLERKKIENDLKETQKLIVELKTILSSEKKILSIIKAGLADISDKYGDERRTKVIKSGARVISPEDLIPDEENALVLTSGGYIKRTNPDEFKKQKRGGVGVVDLNTKEEDFVTTFLNASTHSDLLFFTDKGKAYQIKMYDIPEGRRATKGKSILNFLSLEAEEKVTSVLSMPIEIKQSPLSILMVTKGGTAKKVAAKSFHDVRRSGIIAIKLPKGDELVSASFVAKSETIMAITGKGQSIHFKESDIREMGRSAGGVRCIRLSRNDFIVGAYVVTKDMRNPFLLVVSSNGFGKKTSIKEYKIQKRGGSGIKTANVTTKTGQLVASKIVEEEDSEIVAISKKSQVIRVGIEEIPLLSRSTQGVRIMKLRDKDSIASLICL
ncbi:MAG: DNA gyrase subunit A [Candidatus Pacebacteria bacterium]|nr:DNA gyrase subunit A [Candidatus Paceibacterota bacterium]